MVLYGVVFVLNIVYGLMVCMVWYGFVELFVMNFHEFSLLDVYGFVWCCVILYCFVQCFVVLYGFV